MIKAREVEIAEHTVVMQRKSVQAFTTDGLRIRIDEQETGGRICIQLSSLVEGVLPKDLKLLQPFLQSQLNSFIQSIAEEV